jgi:anthranilate synthase/aminodeoxychorismate synthase-like glutamine amidotransferase
MPAWDTTIEVTGSYMQGFMRIMIQIVDNYDSFTYNLVQRLGELDKNLQIRVDRNDQITVEEIRARKPDRVIISPGPCTPCEAGISVDCVKQLAGKIPLLGVCLGHQSIAQAFGAKIVRADRLMHGKIDKIYHDGQGLFAGLDNPFQATRYHSLIIQSDTLPDELEVSAWSEPPEGPREIMAVRHRKYPLVGLQFHPESFLTNSGPHILQRFLQLG